MIRGAKRDDWRFSVFHLVGRPFAFRVLPRKAYAAVGRTPPIAFSRGYSVRDFLA